MAVVDAIDETEYGFRKRLEYATAVVDRLRPDAVLDVGCGTGSLLTAPLAHRFPGMAFVGTDTDERSLEHGRRAFADLTNLEFARLEAIGDRRFALIIASEVLEHVDDPPAFLRDLRSRLAPGGRVLLTVPNGYGPYEVGTIVEAALRVSGAYGVLRRAKRAVAGGPPEAPVADTLAVSPHLNFFTARALRRLTAGVGLAVEEERNRTFLCGFGVGSLVRGERAVAWNARVADRLPAALASDWMLLLAPAGPDRALPYRRTPLARARRRLNERRWGLAP